MFLFLSNLLKSSLQNELDRFFQVLSNDLLSVHKVTDSAFCQARKKMKASAFKELDELQPGLCIRGLVSKIAIMLFEAYSFRFPLGSMHHIN